MTEQNQAPKALHISLWVAQILFAALFLMAGTFKIIQPIEALAVNMHWVLSTPAWLVRFIGISELLGGLGLVLPSLLRIKPQLTVWAAIGLAVVMVLAAITHVLLAEYPGIAVNAAFIAGLVFIVWGRATKAPIR